MMNKASVTSLMSIILLAALSSDGWAQVGSRRRGGDKQWGVHFRLALYQYDETRSGQIADEFRLPGTFDSARTETQYLRDVYKLEDVMQRHVRSVGLKAGESFLEAVHLGEQHLILSIRVEDLSTGWVTMNVNIKGDETALLEKTHLRLKHHRTLALKGGRGQFGLKTFQGPQGPEQVPAERTLLVTATAVIVPADELRHRPRDFSHPIDQYGREIKLGRGDIFLPPVLERRVAPRVVVRRALQATILLEGHVTPAGAVTNVRVLQTFDSAFNQMAIDALKQYKVSPARLNGKPVTATLREAIVFRSPQ